MTLDDALDNIGADVAGPDMAGGCKVGRTLDTVTADQAAKIRAKMTPGQSLEKLAAALRRGGHPIGSTTLRRHRNKACQCYDPASVTA